MLKKIPDSSIRFARDGVIDASSLGYAVREHRLLAFAKRRAAKILDEAQAQADSLRAEARQAGYVDGMEAALAAAVPKLAELLSDETTLKAEARTVIEAEIRATLADAGLEESLVAVCCHLEDADKQAPDGPWTLFLPADRADLVRRLGARIPPGVFEIRIGELPWPVIERGDRIVEINPVDGVLRHLRAWIDERSLAEALRQRASDYASAVRKATEVPAIRKHQYRSEDRSNQA